MKILNLLEARRFHEHPAQSRKYGFSEIFKNYLKLPEEEREDLFVSMTLLNKVGINPKSAYDTPIGVYAYPLNYFLNLGDRDRIPFRSSAPNMWVLQSIGNPLHIKQNVSPSSEDFEKIANYIRNIPFFTDDHRIRTLLYERRHHSSLYYLVRAISEKMAKFTPNGRKDLELHGDMAGSDSASSTILMTKIFTKVLGYDSIIDHGTSTIHGNEPQQAVFLTPRSFTVIEKFDNKIENNRVTPGPRKYGEFFKEFINTPNKYIIGALEGDYPNFYLLDFTGPKIQAYKTHGDKKNLEIEKNNISSLLYSIHHVFDIDKKNSKSVKELILNKIFTDEEIIYTLYHYPIITNLYNFLQTNYPNVLEKIKKTLEPKQLRVSPY